MFQFDDWKEEAQKSKDMEALVQRLLSAPGADADAAVRSRLRERKRGGG